MLKAEFRFFIVDFMPFFIFRIGVGHVAITIKNYVLVLNFCSTGSPALDLISAIAQTRPHAQSCTAILARGEQYCYPQLILCHQPQHPLSADFC